MHFLLLILVLLDLTHSSTISLDAKHSQVQTADNGTGRRQFGAAIPAEGSSNHVPDYPLSKVKWAADCGRDKSSLPHNKFYNIPNLLFAHHPIPFENDQKRIRLKYVELVIVHSYSNYEAYKFNKTKVFDRIQKIINLVNELFLPFNIKFALVDVVIWTTKPENTTVGDLESFDEGPLSGDEILERFARYRQITLLKRGGNDNAVLFIAKKMVTETGSTEIGRAYISGMCKDSSSVGVVYDSGRPTIPHMASTLAHELGHSFGLDHYDSCHCPADVRSGCIMDTYARNQSTRTWTRCSMRGIETIKQYEWVPCIDDIPENKLFASPTCQNGFVEEGEECDCGTKPNMECMRCCNVTTCKLLPKKQCANGLCCDSVTCKFAPEALQCRAATGPCDLPEYCSGKAHSCPIDVFKRNGLVCKSDAYCFDGECHSATDHCRELWGTNSSSSRLECFQQNTIGHSTGYCKTMARGEEYDYIPCAQKDMLCGLASCRNRQFYLPEKAHLDYYDIGDGIRVDCAFVTFIPMNRVRQLGLVPNGASCGSDKMCADSKCVSVGEFLAKNNVSDACAKNCSGHGVCNSMGQCHCDTGYGSDNCGEQVIGPTDLDNSAGGHDDATLVAVGIILTMLSIVVILAIIVYGSREKISKYKTNWPFKLLFKNTCNLKGDQRLTECTQVPDTIGIGRLRALEHGTEPQDNGHADKNDSIDDDHSDMWNPSVPLPKPSDVTSKRAGKKLSTTTAVDRIKDVKKPRDEPRSTVTSRRSEKLMDKPVKNLMALPKVLRG